MYNHAERTYPDSRGTVVCRAEATLIDTFDFVTEVECFTQRETFNFIDELGIKAYESDWYSFDPLKVEYHTISYYDMVELGEGFRAFPSALIGKIISYKGELFRLIEAGSTGVDYKLVPTKLLEDKEEPHFLPFWA